MTNKEVADWQSLWDSRMWKLAIAMFLAALTGSAIGNKIPWPW